VWVFRWSRELLEEDLIQANELSFLLDGIVRPNSEDMWCCSLDPIGGYSVKAAYSFLAKKSAGTMVPSAFLVSALARVSKSRAPPKVAAFSWQLLQDRVPTRHNLFRRRVIHDQGDTLCVFCGVAEESTDHLFCSCEAILSVRYGISRWMGWDLVPHSSILGSFLSFQGLGSGKKVALGLRLVWLAIVWVV